MCLHARKEKASWTLRRQVQSPKFINGLFGILSGDATHHGLIRDILSKSARRVGP